MYGQPVSTWRQPIHHSLYHTTLSVHLNRRLWQVHGVYLGQPDHPLGPLCVVVAIPTDHGHCCPKASSPNQHYGGENLVGSSCWCLIVWKFSNLQTCSSASLFHYFFYSICRQGRGDQHPLLFQIYTVILHPCALQSPAFNWKLYSVCLICLWDIQPGNCRLTFTTGHPNLKITFSLNSKKWFFPTVSSTVASVPSPVIINLQQTRFKYNWKNSFHHQIYMWHVMLRIILQLSRHVQLLQHT